MIVKFEGREADAQVSEVRCHNFVSISLWVNGELVPLPDTFSMRYQLVSASDREREMLRGSGYRLCGL
jgi:hypothetical protein